MSSTTLVIHNTPSAGLTRKQKVVAISLILSSTRWTSAMAGLTDKEVNDVYVSLKEQSMTMLTAIRTMVYDIQGVILPDDSATCDWLLNDSNWNDYHAMQQQQKNVLNNKPAEPQNSNRNNTSPFSRDFVTFTLDSQGKIVTLPGSRPNNANARLLSGIAKTKPFSNYRPQCNQFTRGGKKCTKRVCIGNKTRCEVHGGAN